MGAVPAAAAAPADNAWQQLGAIPAMSGQPVFALQVDPASADRVLAGTGAGDIYRSTDGGTSWTRVAAHLGAGVLALEFPPAQPGVALAGTRGDGIWRSADAGAHWARASGTKGRTVRAFDAAGATLLAGTDRGVYESQDGGHWKTTGPGDVDVSAIAVAPGGDASHVLIGSDAGALGGAPPLYASRDGGRSWDRTGGSMNGSSMVDALAGWASGGGGQLVVGTNAGAFSSGDGGAHWSAVTGDGSLPAIDVTGVQPLRDTPGQYYVASDGGGSDEGGLWVTRDGGDHFSSLKPPLPSVTAISVAPGAAPIVYAATFRPADHAVLLWAYRDAGGDPQAPPPVPTPRTGQAGDTTAAGGHVNWLQTLFRGPEGPFLAISIAAVLVLVLAWITYARRARRL